jgi:hypothetical protein
MIAEYPLTSHSVRAYTAASQRGEALELSHPPKLQVISCRRHVVSAPQISHDGEEP